VLSSQRNTSPRARTPTPTYLPTPTYIHTHFARARALSLSLTAYAVVTELCGFAGLSNSVLCVLLTLTPDCSHSALDQDLPDEENELLLREMAAMSNARPYLVNPLSYGNPQIEYDLVFGEEIDPQNLLPMMKIWRIVEFEPEEVGAGVCTLGCTRVLPFPSAGFDTCTASHVRCPPYTTFRPSNSATRTHTYTHTTRSPLLFYLLAHAHSLSLCASPTSGTLTDTPLARVLTRWTKRRGRSSTPKTAT
jgi:hypothetical protein